MKVTPIAAPLRGERVVAVSPRMAIQVDASWRRRLNLFTGRTLSDTALATEQRGRDGRLVSLAQLLSPGVVSGLELDLDVAAQSLYLAPGTGLTAWGEDVIIPRPVQVKVADLVTPIPGAGQFGVLLLVPVTVRRSARFDAQDSCDVDETDDAFADEQDIDGCQLKYFPCAPIAAGPATPSWQNQVAYSIFAQEQALPFGEIQPWEDETGGVPIGLIGFGPAGAAWVDRYSVVRVGGKAKRRAPLVAGAGSAFLWQARLQQFAEQLSTQMATAPNQRIAAYALLPPAGMLPRDAADLFARTNTFFPPSWAVRAIPLPIEQLDAVIDSASSLAPIATDHGERVILLVPVPQSVYEPRLLIDDVVDPIFQQRIDEFATERDIERRARELMRLADRDLVRAVDGAKAVPVFPAIDPDAGAAEPPVAALTSPEKHAVFVTLGLTDDEKVQALLDLVTELRPNPALPPPVFSQAEWDALAAVAKPAVANAPDTNLGLGAFVASMKAKLQRADDTVDFSFLKSHPTIYRVRQQLLGNTAATRLATSPALATIAKGESAQAVADDVNRYFFAVTKRLPPGILPPVTGAAPQVLEKAPNAPAAAPAAAPAPVDDRTKHVSGLAPQAAAGKEPALALQTNLSLGVTKTVSTGTVLKTVKAPVSVLGAGGFQLIGKGVVQRDPLVLPPPPTRKEIQHAAPVAGDGAYDFRTVSIAQRFEDPAAKEAKAYAVAARAEAVEDLKALSDLGMNVDDIQIFGVPEFTGSNAPVYYPDLLPIPAGQTVAPENPRRFFPKRSAVTFKTLITTLGGSQRLLNDPPPLNGDEGQYFSEAVTVIEHMIATLRAIEARVAEYKAAVARCEAVLAQITDLRDRAAARLSTLDAKVSEARHKVATATALLADETARINAINERRHAVLREHVQFLAYVRPRYMDARVDTPVLHLNPGLFEAPVPACLAAHDDVPQELEQMIHLLREAPVSWFVNVPKVLEKLDRVELLHGTLQVAKTRALALRDTGQTLSTFINRDPVGRFGPAIARVTQAQQRVVTDFRLQVASLDLARFAGRGWRQTQEDAVQILSLGDLIESNHGRSTVADAAAGELNQITRIAACLHAQACDVLPVIRLGWADRLSQFDKAVSLRDLTVLPRWGEVDFNQRKEIQTLADWLYGRIDPAQADGVSWMHDLVRVCLLLASHAPVNQIIAGQVPVPTRAAPGRTVPIAIDPTQVRLGMKVFFYGAAPSIAGRPQPAAVIAHGVVEDLVGGQARARIAEAFVDDVTLDKGTRVQFVHPEARDLPTFMRKLV